MTGQELRQKYLDFFRLRKHTIIAPAPLVPQEDPTTLFTGSGMQPLVPYLLGQKHPQGIRLANSQPAFRAEDLEKIGDDRHTTFFEMLGNWSLGDYFKSKQLSWFWQFITQELSLPPHRLYVTVFSGDQQNKIPQDNQSAKIWQQLFAKTGLQVSTQDGSRAAQEGMDKNAHIFYYGSQKNWWSRQGIPENMSPGEPGGPDSEVFFEFTQINHDPQYGPHCHPNCECGRFFEIGNSVFMQYQKQSDGSFQKLDQPNVDFGGGLERMLAAAYDTPDMFLTDLFKPIIDQISQLTESQYRQENKTSFQIITDHLKAATFMIAQGVRPSNKQQGYVLRRLLRNASMAIYNLTDNPASTQLIELTRPIIDIYKKTYPYLKEEEDKIQKNITIELKKFSRALKRGLRELDKHPVSQINEKIAFDLYQTYGLPFEITQQLLARKNHKLDKDRFDQLQKKHAQKSRSASTSMFKGGLADHSETTTRFHTATHLIHQALREILGSHVKQIGSNITQERLRFDFTHPQKLTKQQIKKIEDLVNQKIDENLPVTFQTMTLDKAKSQGALAFFEERYDEQKVKVYKIGDFSLEVCNGPHVENTGEIGHIKIYKQTSVGTGRRRIYADFV